MNDGTWKLRGLCRDEAFLEANELVADDWFLEVRRLKTAQAKEACLSCPIKLQCRTEAREEGIPDGVWGGEDERERAAYWAANGGQPSHFAESLRYDAITTEEAVA